MAAFVKRLLHRCCPCRYESSEEDVRPKTVNIVVGFFWLVNWQLGTGFLGIPFPFGHGGLIAGAASLVVIAFVCWITGIWILEVIARAQAITDQSNSESDAGLPISTLLQPTRKFEITELCSIFLGRWSKYIYLAINTLCSLLALLAFTTVAGSAWAVNLPLNFANVHQCTNIDFHFHTLPTIVSCRNAYWFCLFLFGCIVVPLSMIELKEQAIVQITLSVMRFVAIGAIVLFCITNLITSGNICTCSDPWTNASLQESFDEQCNITTTFVQIATHFDFKMWINSIPILAFALTLNIAIPYLIHPVKQKRHLTSLLHVVFVVIASLYLLVGVSASLWWKDCINEACSLNWDPLSEPPYSLSLRILSYYIILFPSIDVISVFSLTVLNITNNAFVGILGKDTAGVMKSKRSYFLILTIKFFSALTPILIAMAVSNLVTVLKYVGLLVFIIGFFVPILLQLRSQWVCRRVFMAAMTKQVDLQNTSSDHKDDSVHQKSAEQFSLLSSHFDGKPSDLYMTPYSNLCSYWPAVAIVTVVTVMMFAFTIASLFF